MNGSLASGVTLSGGSLGGSGSVAGLTANDATLAPGNSIGTLTVTGNFVQNGGTYQVEANAAGQSDRINVTGSATINGAARAGAGRSPAATRASRPTPSSMRPAAFPAPIPPSPATSPS